MHNLEHALVARRVVSRERDQLGHVHALVAHPLDVLDHVQDGRDEAQVRGHGRLEGEQREHPLVHLEIAAVDAVVVRDDHARELDVLVLHGLEGTIECRHHHLECAQRLALESRELLLEVRAGRMGQANRPCR
jgi:hypothetical protein